MAVVELMLAAFSGYAPMDVWASLGISIWVILIFKVTY